MSTNLIWKILFVKFFVSCFFAELKTFDHCAFSYSFVPFFLCARNGKKNKDFFVLFQNKIMDCAGCLKKNRIQFEKKTCLFEDRHHLAVFLLNVILNIQYEETGFCRCKRQEICLVCQAKTYYQNYQYKIYEHSLDFNFLAKLRENLYRNMLKLLTLDNHFVLSIKNTNIFIVIGSLVRNMSIMLSFVQKHTNK